MLRDAVLGLAALLTIGGAALLVVAPPAGVQLLAFGLILLVGTLFERVRYKRLASSAPDARFQRTPERFVDETTGAPVTVWVDPATGERSYVKE